MKLFSVTARGGTSQVKVNIDGQDIVGRQSIVVEKSGVVTVDGQTLKARLVGDVKITVLGDVDSLTTTNGDTDIQGNVGSIHTTNGGINCRDVGGNVHSVNGDIICGNIAGTAVSINGKVLGK